MCLENSSPLRYYINIRHFLYFDSLIFNSIVHSDLSGEQGYDVRKETNFSLTPQITYLTQYQLLKKILTFYYWFEMQPLYT